MQINTTKLFDSRFSTENYKLKFIENFKRWEQDGEFSSVYFGKDGGFRDVKLNNGEYLRHIHLVPISSIERTKWTQAHERNGKKVSNSSLIYAKKNNKVILLDYIKDGAHEEFEYDNGKISKKLLWALKVANKFFEQNIIVEQKSSFIILQHLLKFLK
jgi:hypothetical protein